MSVFAWPSKVRTLFISDLHLGYRISRGDRCQRLLASLEAENFYLVGDGVDETRLRDRWYWPEAHDKTVQAICDFAERCSGAFLTPGNHDLGYRQKDLSGLYAEATKLSHLLTRLLDFEIADELTYVSGSGKKYLVAHGDLFDSLDAGKFGVVRRGGGRIFDQINVFLPRSLILAIRAFFKLVLARPRHIEQTICDYAKESGFDGVVFGHLHEPNLAMDDGFLIANTGDWVINESFLI
jgi:UDP-2,3-diacylglucosamine pyrophosphatase LpxH